LIYIPIVVQFANLPVGRQGKMNVLKVLSKAEGRKVIPLTDEVNCCDFI